jgi:hypothetical protein
VAVDELDRIFHRDDVTLPLLVDLVDHRGERRRLARAGGTRHQHQPPRPLRKLRDHRRKPEVLKGSHIEGNHADYEGNASALLEDVAAEPGEVLDAEGKVELVLLLETLLLVLGEDRVGELEGVLGCEDVGHRAVGDVAVHPDLGPLTRGAMQVGGFLLDHLFEQRSQIDAHPAVSLTTSSTVVIPRSIFFMPSIRSVSIPSATP